VDKPKPRPKWIVLQVLNFVVMGTFVGSITYLFINYRNGKYNGNGTESNAFSIM
jgi:hypothetical protein